MVALRVLGVVIQSVDADIENCDGSINSPIYRYRHGEL